MRRWEAFKVDPEHVRCEVERGHLDYVEVASHVAETRFFRDHYENSVVMRFDQHNHPVDRKKLSAAELDRQRHDLPDLPPQP